MKITRNQLRRLIKEEVSRIVNEAAREGVPSADAPNSEWKTYFQGDCEKQASGFTNTSIKKLAVDACVQSRMKTRSNRRSKN